MKAMGLDLKKQMDMQAEAGRVLAKLERQTALQRNGLKDRYDDPGFYDFPEIKKKYRTRRGRGKRKLKPVRDTARAPTTTTENTSRTTEEEDDICGVEPARRFVEDDDEEEDDDMWEAKPARVRPMRARARRLVDDDEDDDIGGVEPARARPVVDDGDEGDDDAKVEAEMRATTNSSQVIASEDTTRTTTAPVQTMKTTKTTTTTVTTTITTITTTADGATTTTTTTMTDTTTKEVRAD